MLSYQEPPDEREGLDLYPTQKTTKLLTRIISAASGLGDIVLDCFVGSGVVAKVAQRLGRRWIGCDINKEGILHTAQRLRVTVSRQVGMGESTQPPLQGLGSENPRPAQLGFTVWRVNDYDLQIQHNEAANLAVELLGVERTRTDGFFNGTLSRSLVKIA